MDINSIGAKYKELSAELKKTVAKMERTDRVFVIRDEIKDLQQLNMLLISVTFEVSHFDISGKDINESHP